MKDKMIHAHLNVANEYSKLSHAVRLKVGCVIVKEDRIISIGYNGTPSGWDNVCEEVIEQHEDGGQVLKTKPEVLHAEQNAIAKLAKSNDSGLGADMFITHAPCVDCAKLILQSGINNVFYRSAYRDDAGIKFLEKGKVKVIHVKDS
jgi:dCMP deaminase